MQQLGQLMNPRDERGWMMPRPGTVRRRVYDALLEGKTASEIRKELDLGRAAYDNHRFFITSWKNANANSYSVKKGVRTLRRIGNEFVEIHA